MAFSNYAMLVLFMTVTLSVYQINIILCLGPGEMSDYKSVTDQTHPIDTCFRQHSVYGSMSVREAGQTAVKVMLMGILCACVCDMKNTCKVQT